MVTPLITGQRVTWRPEDFHVGPVDDSASYVGAVMGFRVSSLIAETRNCWHIVGDHHAVELHAYILSDASLELAVAATAAKAAAARTAPSSSYGYGQSNQTRLDIVPVRFLAVVDDSDLDTHELLDRLGVRLPRRGQLIGPLPDMYDSHDRLSPAAREAIKTVLRFDVVDEAAGRAVICDRHGLLQVYSGARAMAFFADHYTLHEHERILRLVEVLWRHHMGMDNAHETTDTVLDSASKGP